MNDAKNNFIPIAQPSISKKDIEYVTDAVKSGWVSSLGSYIQEFEEKFAAFCNTRYALTTSNGTSALHLTLAAKEIGEGDEILVPDFSFIATANSVVYSRATPVFIDIDPITLCIDPKVLKRSLTPRTKAIIVVHTYGHPANMDEINKIANDFNLYVIEDAAEAHGAEYKGKPVGGLATAGCFSFYGNKLITSGEGGMITTDDPELYSRACLLRDHAMSKEKKYWHTSIGYNYRMTNLQAALGVAQMERIDEFLAKKKLIFFWYQQRLSGIQNVRLNAEETWAKNSYWVICVEIRGYSEQQRDELMVILRKHGIDSRPYFYPISHMPMFNRAVSPVSSKISKIGLNLPCFHDITEQQVEYICEKLLSYLESNHVQA